LGHHITLAQAFSSKITNVMDLRSHYPFWLMKHGLVTSYPSLHTSLRADAAIIGAGISGALMAWYLSRQGLGVAVLDRRHTGMGSTVATTGLLQYELDVPMHELAGMIGERPAIQAYRMCREAIAELAELCDRLGPDTGFVSRPSLQYASSRSHRHALQLEYSMRLRHGFDVNWLEPAEIRNLYGFEAPGALLSEDAAEIDAYMLTHRLLQQARERGAQIFDNTAVERLDAGSGGVMLHTGTGHTIQARTLILACGYETLQYLPFPIARVQSTYALVSEPLPDLNAWHRRSLIWETARPYQYARFTDDERVLLGGLDDNFYNPSLRDSRILKKASRLEASFTRMFPQIPIHTDFAWAGAFVTTKDGLPYIGSIPQLPHTFLSLGYGGNGILFSLIAARLILGMMRGRPDKRSALFSFDR
jgi:glycine/D-amino acid oxidase-like deaminating enzyme